MLIPTYSSSTFFRKQYLDFSGKKYLEISMEICIFELVCFCLEFSTREVYLVSGRFEFRKFLLQFVYRFCFSEKKVKFSVGAAISLSFECFSILTRLLKTQSMLQLVNAFIRLLTQKQIS